MAKIIATWTRITSESRLSRSSHCVEVLKASNGNIVLYLLGGELKPREPRKESLAKIELDKQSLEGASIKVHSDLKGPSPRVGSATAQTNGIIYMFSGRGGVAMAPIDEKGAIWALTTTDGNESWSLLKPTSNAYPEARSYHCMTANGNDTLYIHAGCPEKGRLSDLWSFNLQKREWKQLEPAPAPPRGGASITYAQGKIYRMNGFDGQKEQGGSIDIFDPVTNSWSLVPFEADGKAAPGARSVAVLLSVAVNGSPALVTMFGESDPSSLGHQGAGKMLNDVWVYEIDEGKWHNVEIAAGQAPEPRGWFDADVITIDGKEGIVVAGGLEENNERLDDVWMLQFS